MCYQINVRYYADEKKQVYFHTEDIYCIRMENGKTLTHMITTFCITPFQGMCFYALRTTFRKQNLKIQFS